MSIEATNAVLEHAQGTDKQWRMLMILALEANARGVVTEVSNEHLAKRMGTNASGVSGVRSGLLKTEQLVVVQEGNKHFSPSYWIKLPGLPGPEVLEEKPEPAPSTKRTEPSTMSGKEKAFLAVMADAGYNNLTLTFSETDKGAGDPVGQMAFDGLDLLRQGKKVDSKLVTPEEMALATVGLVTFNFRFEWKDPTSGKVIKGSDYGLGANLTQVVMRVRERPSWDAAAHIRLVESAWRIRWWEKQNNRRRPSPNVIWSQKSFEQVVQDAVAEKESKGKTGRRFTRS